MKKLLVNFVALHGGGTTYAFQMVKALAENGCEIYAIISTEMENYQRWVEINNIHLLPVKGYSNKLNFYPRLISFKLFKLPKIYRMVKKIGIDAVYIPMISYWTYTIFKQFKKFRNIYTMHDVRPHDENTSSIIWKHSQRIAHQSEEIIILSNCFKKEISNEYGKDFLHIHKLSLGYQNYYTDTTIKKKKDPNIFHFVFYGRIDDYKGLDVLAKAFSSLLTKYNNVHLLVAGSGDFSPYTELYKQLDESRVKVINRWIKDEEVPLFFDTAKNITILPYKNATQSGIVPIAMTFKSLIISTNCSGLSEQVIDGVTGLLLNPDNVDELVEKMEYAINNWEIMEKIINNAYSEIKTSSWDNIANCFVKGLFK